MTSRLVISSEIFDSLSWLCPLHLILRIVIRKGFVVNEVIDRNLQNHGQGLSEYLFGRLSKLLDATQEQETKRTRNMQLVSNANLLTEAIPCPLFKVANAFVFCMAAKRK